MKRQISLNEISDGRLYGINDMVRADCKDCEGCSACCHGMGNTIVLDPYDIYRLTTNLHQNFESLMQEAIELSMVDGTILPNLRLAGEQEACFFLDASGRCSIHPYRPGICRLFPLGRYYENGGFQYFLQIHECQKQNRSKIKVRKWIDTPEISRYEQYVTDWHYFLIDIQEQIAQNAEAAFAKEINLYVLQIFYMTPYQEGDFYSQFYERFEKAKEKSEKSN